MLSHRATWDRSYRSGTYLPWKICIWTVLGINEYVRDVKHSTSDFDASVRRKARHLQNSVLKTIATQIICSLSTKCGFHSRRVGAFCLLFYLCYFICTINTICTLWVPLRMQLLFYLLRRICFLYYYWLLKYYFWLLNYAYSRRVLTISRRSARAGELPQMCPRSI